MHYNTQHKIKDFNKKLTLGTNETKFKSFFITSYTVHVLKKYLFITGSFKFTIITPHFRKTLALETLQKICTCNAKKLLFYILMDCIFVLKSINTQKNKKKKVI